MIELSRYMANVEIVYVTADKTVIHHHCMVAAGATVADALQQSGLLDTHPEIHELTVGIFAKPVTLNTLLQQGDRIELYRPLTNDPKEKRKQLANKDKIKRRQLKRHRVKGDAR